MNLTSLECWIIVAKDGSVITAHCTCVAGMGEVCSHIGATLYGIENIIRMKENTSCTDLKSIWTVPNVNKVEMLPISNINLGKSTHVPGSSRKIVPYSPTQIQSMLQEVENAKQVVALMTVVEPFASKMRTDTSKSILRVYDVYNSDYEKLEYEALDALYLQNINHFKMTKEDCVHIFESTKQQSRCSEWFAQRAGRLTASKIKNILRSNINNPSLSLIKQICYPAKMKFSSKYTEWGIKHESVALDKYMNENKVKHNEFKIEESGLIILPQCNYLAAIPDALVSCSCCGHGCVEIKCPFILKDNKISLHEFADIKTSCLVKDDHGNICLSNQHGYYYQIQMQIQLAEVEYCDFVIWGPSVFFIERVYKCVEFWQLNFPKLADFHRKVIMPELYGRYFTKSKDSQMREVWCICEGYDNGEPMIKCQNENCEIQWFHMNCVNIADNNMPLFWMCATCSNLESETFST